MIRLRPIAFLCALALTPGLLSQQTIVVDANNAPGTDFVDLQSGIIAASPGDTVLVRPGPVGTQYPAAIATRGITIRGEPGAPPVLQRLTLRGLRSFETLVLSNLVFTTFDPVALLVEDCDGPVHLDNVSDGPVSFFGMNLLIVRCAAVTLTDVDRVNTIRIEDSRVAASNLVANTPPIIGPTVPTVLLRRSTLSLARSTVLGFTRQTLACLGTEVATPAVALDQSELIYDRATTIEGGEITTQLPIPMTCSTAPAIVGPSGTVRGPTATGSVPGVSFVQEAVFPASVAYDPSGDLLVSVGAEGNAGALLFAGFVDTPVLAFPQGILWLQSTQVIPLGFIPANAQGDCVLQLPVPASLPAGLAIGWQFLVGTPTSIVLGEPAVSVVRS